jgi:hypothetical protein
MGYQAEIGTVPFLFEPLRGPVVGSLKSLAAGEIDVYLWALWQGVPGREPQPALAAAALALWTVAMLLVIQGLRAALRRNASAAST